MSKYRIYRPGDDVRESAPSPVSASPAAKKKPIHLADVFLFVSFVGVLLFAAACILLVSGAAIMSAYHFGTFDWLGSLGGIPPGPRGVVVIHETEDQTPATGRLIVKLRNGEAAAYFKDKEHSLLILDKDAKDKDGNPSPVVKEWLGQIGDMPLPVLVIYEPKSRKLLIKESLAKDATVDTILAALKAKGG